MRAAALPRPISGEQVASLVLLFAPGGLFAIGLIVLREQAVAAAFHVAVIGVAGVVATAAGVCDWWYHASGRRVVGQRERRTELVALGAGGVPLFGLMAAASVVDAPLVLLAPVLLVVAFIAAAIAHDERRYHVRCSALETAFHRVLVGGMTVAWLAWAHWCFVERVTVA